MVMHDKIEHRIGFTAAERIAQELGVTPLYIGDSIGPSAADGAADRWPLFEGPEDQTPAAWLWDTAVGYELADAASHDAEIPDERDGRPLITKYDLVICISSEGYSLHAPGSTDEEIATGAAPYLVSEAWEGDRRKIPLNIVERAWAILRMREGRIIEAGEGVDFARGHIIDVDGDTANVAWDSGMNTHTSIALLRDIPE